MVKGSIDTRSIECPAVDQEAAHREIGVWEAPTFLNLSEPLTDEVLTAIGDLLHVSLTYLLLEHVILRGSQPRAASVTTTWLSIRTLARFKAKGGGGGLPPIPATESSLAETVYP